MWLHNLKSALRAMASDRFFAFVNLLGLSIGLASVVAISLHVRNELGHDSWLPDHERLFRIDTAETIPGRAPIEIARAPGPLREARMRDVAPVEHKTRAFPPAAHRPSPSPTPSPRRSSTGIPKRRISRRRNTRRS